MYENCYFDLYVRCYLSATFFHSEITVNYKGILTLENIIY